MEKTKAERIEELEQYFSKSNYYFNNKTNDVYEVDNAHVINCTNANDTQIMVSYHSLRPEVIQFVRESNEFYLKFTKLNWTEFIMKLLSIFEVSSVIINKDDINVYGVSNIDGIKYSFNFRFKDNIRITYLDTEIFLELNGINDLISIGIDPIRVTISKLLALGKPL